MNLRFSRRLHYVRLILAFLAACVLLPPGAHAGDKSHHNHEYRRHDGREYRRADFERAERAREMRERAYIAGAVEQERYNRHGYDERYRERYYRHHDHDDNDDDDDRMEGALIGAAVGAIATGVIMSNTHSP